MSVKDILNQTSKYTNIKLNKFRKATSTWINK